jgi:uncharacterized phage protein (TIGR01671 family)
MRIIKFRNWNKKTKDMIYPDRLRELTAEMQSEDEHDVLMQFTGLLDKNGKEIYEGDIVEFRDISSFGSKKIMTGIVHWSEPDTRFKIDYWSFGNEIYSSTLKVIGNAHENPDLLSSPERGK